MQSRETSRSQDPDDWFADLEPAAPGRERLGESPVASPARVPALEAAAEGDDWLGDDARPRVRGKSTLAAQLSDRWVAIAAGVLLVACAAVGASVLAGAFSSSKPQPAALTPPIASTPTTTASTTQSPGATVSPPTTKLKPGDKGTQVRALQRALAHLGYSVGKVDGIYGDATKSAVARFQSAAKLKADGICGPLTLAALVRALRSH